MVMVAQARPSERAEFIKRTYTHLAGAVGTLLHNPTCGSVVRTLCCCDASVLVRVTHFDVFSPLEQHNQSSQKCKSLARWPGICLSDC